MARLRAAADGVANMSSGRFSRFQKNHTPKHSPQNRRKVKTGTIHRSNCSRVRRAGETSAAEAANNAESDRVRERSSSSAFFQGRVNLPKALLTGEIEVVDGSASVPLETLPILKEFYPLWTRRVRHEGWDHLVA